VILASLRIAGDLRDGSGARRGKLAVALAADATTLAHELGGERDLSAVWQGRALPQPGDRAAVTSARARVDRAMGTFRASAAKSDTGGQDQGPRGLVRTALTGLGRLPALRDGIDHGPRTPATVRQAISAYTATTGALLEVAARTPGPAAGSGAARELGALVALAQAEEAASFQRGLGAVVTRSGGFQGRDQQLLAAAMGARQHELAHFLATATPGQRGRYQRAVGAPRVEHADELEALLLGAGRNPTGRVSPDDWLSATERVDALRAVAGWLGTQAVAANRAAIASASASASGRQLANALVLLVAVLSSVALASFLARSMVRPLLLLEQAAI
jgi:Nitrate and nitrite sensing